MAVEFSYRTREKYLESIPGEHFDVLIIGGGISGAGIANILSGNDLKVLLVDRGDFASGTSSGSSKLIHGGLRYLAQGEIREVHELLKERNYLIGHTDIVKPIDFHIIVDQYSWKKYTLRLGLFIYNILSGNFSIPRFRKNTGEYPDSVRGYFTYMDAFTEDSKLVIYNVVTAHENGAVCLNYVEATGLQPAGQEYSVFLKDNLSGREINATARVVINAAGPWAGELMKKLGVNIDAPFRLSKGIHLVLPKSSIPVKHAIAFRSHIDKRQMFVIPREQVVHVGTTDTFVTSPEDFTITDADVDYILKSVSSLFPNIRKEDVITAFAGIRPLFGGGDDPGKVSRDFEIKVHDRIINVLGGKITNYRYAARKVAAVASKLLDRNIKIEGMPILSYHREAGVDQIETEILHECPVTTEDILRRREALRIYSPDKGASMEEHVKVAMMKNGMEVR